MSDEEPPEPLKAVTGVEAAVPEDGTEKLDVLLADPVGITGDDEPFKTKALSVRVSVITEASDEPWKPTASETKQSEFPLPSKPHD